MMPSATSRCFPNYCLAVVSSTSVRALNCESLARPDHWEQEQTPPPWLCQRCGFLHGPSVLVLCWLQSGPLCSPYIRYCGLPTL